MNLDRLYSLLNFMLGLFGFIIALFTLTTNTVDISTLFDSNSNDWLVWLFTGFMLIAFVLVIFNLIKINMFDKLMKSSSGDSGESIDFKKGDTLKNSNVELYSVLGEQKQVYGIAALGIVFSLLCLFTYFAYFETEITPFWKIFSGIIFIIYLLYAIIPLIFELIQIFKKHFL